MQTKCMQSVQLEGKTRKVKEILQLAIENKQKRKRDNKLTPNKRLYLGG